MRIFLVRHGQSQANANWAVNTRVADHAIELTEEGKEQAGSAGKFLREYFTENLLTTGTAGSFIPKIRLWHSPYRRTRQTASEIERSCLLPRAVHVIDAPSAPGVVETRVKEKRDAGASFFLDRREHLLLAEQQFGIFDGLSDVERQAQYPDFQAYYEKCKRFEGKLWPKLPLGESRFEVCQRVHQAFGSFKRDEDRHGITNIVIVGHGTTNRAFVMMWLHRPWEWMQDEPNPKNCSIRLIEHGEDKGYIFDGFDNPPGYKHKTNQETEE